MTTLAHPARRDQSPKVTQRPPTSREQLDGRRQPSTGSQGMHGPDAEGVRPTAGGCRELPSADAQWK